MGYSGKARNIMKTNDKNPPHTIPRILIGVDEQRHLDALADAYNHGFDNFTGHCVQHGWTEWQTRPARCLSCPAKRGSPRSDAPRAVARRHGQSTYINDCAVHGPVLFAVTHGKCLACFTTAGILRTKGKPQSHRAAARLAGKVSYPDRCETHGDAPHSVTHGKCLRCFTTGGILRAPPRNPWG